MGSFFRSLKPSPSLSGQRPTPTGEHSVPVQKVAAVQRPTPEATRSYSCSLAEFPSRTRLVDKVAARTIEPVVHPGSAGVPPASKSSTLDSAELERQLWHLFDDASEEPTLPAVTSPKPTHCAKFGRISVEHLNDTPDGTGMITDLGKFLLDPDAVHMFERIIRNPNASLVATIDGEHASALLRLQSYMMKLPHVLSTIVIGRDGTVMSSSGAKNQDVETIAAWALCVYVNSRIAAQTITSKSSKLKHILLSGTEGTVALSEFGNAILITVTSTDDPDAVSSLVNKLDCLLG